MAAELAKLGIEVHWVSKGGRPPRQAVRDHRPRIAPRRRHHNLRRARPHVRRPDARDRRQGDGRANGGARRPPGATEGHIRGPRRRNARHEHQAGDAHPVRGGHPQPHGPPRPAGGWTRAAASSYALPARRASSNACGPTRSPPRLRQLNPDVAIVTRTIKTFGISEGGPRRDAYAALPERESHARHLLQAGRHTPCAP